MLRLWGFGQDLEQRVDRGEQVADDGFSELELDRISVQKSTKGAPGLLRVGARLLYSFPSSRTLSPQNSRPLRVTRFAMAG